jgi:hypothetical protein
MYTQTNRQTHATRRIQVRRKNRLHTDFPYLPTPHHDDVRVHADNKAVPELLTTAQSVDIRVK